MWHRRRLEAASTPKDASCALKLLWQHETLPLYLMDNHLAALWCWRRHMHDRGEQYRFVHLDAHWDAAADAVSDEWLDANDLDVFTGLRSATLDAPLIRWDNYISPFLAAYPNVARACITAHQDVHMVDENPLGRLDHVEIYSPTSFLEHFDDILDHGTVGQDDDSAVICNLDLDFFFGRLGESGVRRLFADPVIHDVFGMVAKRLPTLRVVTIALSPECCGGWSPALAACERAFAGLDLEMPKISDDVEDARRVRA